MWLADQSVKQPVMALVLNLLLIAFGLIALNRLTVRELPDIDPPVISIETSYRGAAAQTVENRITKVLERNISGIEGIRFINAKSIDGLSTINIEFKLGRDIDAAANDVRERVFASLKDLPDDAEAPTVFKVDSNNNVIIWMNLTSASLNFLELTDFAERQLIDRLSVIEGVARVQIGGGKRIAMRVWLDRQAMVGKQVSVSDIEAALRQSNLELPAGRIESTAREFPVWLESQFTRPEEFANIVIRKEANGHLLRLGEVAKVELGPRDRRSELRGNGQTMIGLGIIKQSTANTLAVANRVKAAIPTFKLPPGTQLIMSYDSSVFIAEAIDEVIKAFALALILVVIVILLFLGSLRALIIPFVTIPISVIASFILIQLTGASLNLLTLLGLVLAIGLVVDDAIVVLENISRRLALGETPLVAAFLGTRQVGFAVVATTLVLLAVFLPITLLQGTIGRMFSEFAYTLAAAVTFSALVSLTLTPVMSVYLLAKPGVFRGVNSAGRLMSALITAYRRSLGWSLRHSYWLMAGFVLFLMLGIGLFRLIPQEVVPMEDRGAFFVLIKAPEGASLSYMQTMMSRVETEIQPYVDQGVVKRYISLFPTGLGEGIPVNNGLLIVVMADSDKRSMDSFTLMNRLRGPLMNIPGIIAIPVMRSALGSQSFAQPVQIVLGGQDYSDLVAWRDILIAAARENPGLVNVDSDYDPSKIQINLKINYDRAADMGVTVEEIARAVEAFLGSREVTTFIDKDEEYDVIIEARLDQKQGLPDLKNIYVRSARTNALIPIANLASYEEVTVPNALFRFNRSKSITVTASLQNGYALGEALAFMERVVAEQLPAQVMIDYKEASRDYKESQGGIYFTFGLALLVMYLVMAAQFGSFIHPLIIMITAPLAIVGALLGLYLAGNTLNIYSQIGMIMLAGLAAKNGILLVEFINQLREEGMQMMNAVIRAAEIRLRPILMTAISTVFGSIPLVFASGAGAESRVSIGLVIFFGVSVATALTLYLVPVFYLKLGQYTKPRNAIEKQLGEELQL